ncbi:LysR family transcriptional regulator [Phyllobacterium salinisoli]|uniref:LysR family transcriptional regulator n=2 Tax=Phyllobacterium salinisoli TaxID=1899321 RepID=A0A368JYF9_9HYPH|nr:LysR family transcriptional regulator [Phyllobacterium salinisoli]
MKGRWRLFADNEWAKLASIDAMTAIKVICTMERPLASENLVEFVMVLRKASYVAAARALALHPSVLSRRIKALEAEMGVRLLNRDTRNVTLTEAGTVFFEHAIDVLSRLNDARAAVSRYAEQPAGMLRLALPNIFGQTQIAPRLPAFMRTYPDLRFDLHFSDHVVDLVSDRFDAAVRIGASESSGDYRMKKIAENTRFLVASQSYVEAHGSPTHPGELHSHRTLHFSTLIHGARWRLNGPNGSVEVSVDPVMNSDNITALHHAALAGQGIAILAGFIADADIKAGRLVLVMEGYRPAPSTVSIIYPRASILPRKVRAFIDFMSTEFSGT